MHGWTHAALAWGGEGTDIPTARPLALGDGFMRTFEARGREWEIPVFWGGGRDVCLVWHWKYFGIFGLLTTSRGKTNKGEVQSMADGNTELESKVKSPARALSFVRDYPMPFPPLPLLIWSGLDGTETTMAVTGSVFVH
jgi:hypothetical protein